jgi:hypothetical protein
VDEGETTVAVSLRLSLPRPLLEGRARFLGACVATPVASEPEPSEPDQEELASTAQIDVRAFKAALLATGKEGLSLRHVIDLMKANPLRAATEQRPERLWRRPWGPVRLDSLCAA